MAKEKNSKDQLVEADYVEVRQVAEPAKKPFMSIPASILVASAIISFSILLGTGVIKLKGVTTNAGVPTQAAAVPAASVAPTLPNAPTLPTGPVKVSVDDDPVLGDKNAPVTLIEFSDYECPFCKRHFEQTLPQLMQNYINTGKVKLVFRDLPLTFHDPLATTEAMAANCARETIGDSGYFKLHDEIFKATTSNGSGLTEAKLYELVGAAGANVDNVKACVAAKKYQEEITKDIADGNAVGATGTPSFFVGKSTSNGEIDGTLIVGAVPYSQFQTEIDKLLK